MGKTRKPSFAILKKTVEEYNPKANFEIIKKAYDFSSELHKDQTRASGEPYFVHPFEVAMILAELKTASSTIAAGLLHDVLEDTPVTKNKLAEEFNEEIALLVEGLTNIDKMNFESLEDYKAENIRKMLLATTKDVRIMFIKLADRLHNMRTLKHFRADKQKRIAKETLEIYAPIAHKLGMWIIKGELEDLSLRYLEPEVYTFLRAKINEKREERVKNTEDVIQTIENALKENGVEAEVYGRAKYFYSIYKKMIKKKVDFNEIYDLIGIRIVAQTIPGCYTALGTIHDLWKPLPKRFKDYIATPKANGYQSLHTAVIGKHGKILEVQIRTEEMHRVAEDGVAAHWRYHGKESDKRFDKKVSWLKQLLEWRSSSDADEFIDNLKFDLFDKEIVVFTPKGDPIILPEDATPIDFAYMVHSNVGDKCSKAKVNSKLVPLDTKLRPGDIIEIITTKNATPSRNWLAIVKTSKARTKIRGALGIVAEDKKKPDEDDELSEKFLIDHIEVKDKKITAPVKISKCCAPKYKQSIVAFLTKDKKVTVHKKSCPNVHALNEQKEVPVGWLRADDIALRTLKINVKDRVGLLIDILKEVSSNNVNISHISSDTSKENALITLKIETINDKKIQSLMKIIREMDDVIAVNELK